MHENIYIKTYMKTCMKHSEKGNPQTFGYQLAYLVPVSRKIKLIMQKNTTIEMLIMRNYA